MQTPEQYIEQIGQNARAAALVWGVADAARKNAVLKELSARIRSGVEKIIAANQKDLDAGKAAGLSAALIDRLTLNPERIEKMAQRVDQVAALPDPVGEQLERVVRPNGLVIRKVRVPIGVIGVIYESRPNVTVDCAALCLKSGNAAILRGGKEAIHSNAILAQLIRESLQACGETPDAVQWINTPDRAVMAAMLKADQYIHCIIPRGGEGLIRFVAENARMPVIKHYNGVCSLYLDKDADAAMSVQIALNAKTQRPGVCNAIENLVVHEDAAQTLLPVVAQALVEKNVQLRADERAAAILKAAALPFVPAQEADWGTEYLDLVLSVKIADSLEEAVAFINRYDSAHSEAIVTNNPEAARIFQTTVDAAAVFWNASTRFNDGFEFGLGAEIGISTDRLHARGPVGLRELCSYKYLVDGTGQVRN